MAQRCEILDSESGSAGSSQNDPIPQHLGARYLGDGRCQFLVWAPTAKQVELRFVSLGNRFIPMNQAGRGYFNVFHQRVEITSASLHHGNETVAQAHEDEFNMLGSRSA